MCCCSVGIFVLTVNKVRFRTRGSKEERSLNNKFVITKSVMDIQYPLDTTKPTLGRSKLSNHSTLEEFLLLITFVDVWVQRRFSLAKNPSRLVRNQSD